jgi:putative transposase
MDRVQEHRDLSEQEKEIIERYRLGARMLEPLIERPQDAHTTQQDTHLPFREGGLAQPNTQKQKRRRGVRYEREHSMSAGHMARQQ